MAERVWYGHGRAVSVVRTALAPAALLFRAATATRGALYDRGVLHARPLGAPSLGVGNLTVGGTGKTPVAAWACAELRQRGAHPALLMRGVGGDEAQVHALLNPGMPVVSDPDRVRGAAGAAALGANCLVLDDAFQHRRARRDVDFVLISAEQFELTRVHLLPAGPYREGLNALSRAAVAVVTRKSAPPKTATAAADALARYVRAGAVAVVHLAAAGLRRWPGDVLDAPGAGSMQASQGADTHELDTLRAAPTLVVAGVGNPEAFAAQLADVGARVELARYPDHHAYTEADAARLAERAARGGPELRVVTTLKDAVKLGPRWPRGAPPLWYVSQRVTVERGGGLLAAHLDAIAAAARVPFPRPPVADALQP